MPRIKKSLVIGATGYLGSNLCKILHDNDHFVTGTGRNTEAPIYLQAHNYIQLDLESQSDLEQLDLEYDYIFLFAAKTGTLNSFENAKEFISINEIALTNLLNKISQLSVSPKIIFPSSRLVYKGKDSALVETDQLYSKTIYARNKISCESYLSMYSKLYGINYTIFRICIPYGNLVSDNISYGTIGYFMNCVANNVDISLFGDGSQKRSFTHIEDLCYMILESLNYNEETNNEIFNIDGEDFSLKDAAGLFSSHYGVDVKHTDWPDSYKIIESGHTYFNGNKLNSIINYKRKRTLKNWLLTLNN